MLKIRSLFILAMMFNAQSAFALRPMPKSIVALDGNIKQSWCRSSVGPHAEADIGIIIGEDGKLFNPTLHSSGDLQYDAECLEAVLGQSPVNPGSSNEGILETRNISFNEGMKPRFEGSEIREYLKAHPQPKSADQGFVVVHKIPPGVLIRYPGMFEESEIFNASNLVEIRGADHPHGGKSFVTFLAHMYRVWSDTFQNLETRKATILKLAESAPFCKTW